MKDSATLRFVDHHVGRILCGLLSLPNLLSLGQSVRSGRTYQNILVVELFEMGATTMIFPSLHYLMKRNPTATIYCLTTESIRASWEVLGCIPRDRIFSIGGKGPIGFAISAISQIVKLRKIPFDLILDYELFFRASAVIVSLLKAKAKAGFHKYQLEGLGRGRVYSIRCSYNQNQHISKNFLALTKTALENKDDYPNLKDVVTNDELTLPEYSSNREVKNKLLQRLSKVNPAISPSNLLVISPAVGPNLAVRNYPAQRFSIVIRQILAANPGLFTILVGTASDRPIGEIIIADVNNDRAVNLCGETSFIELMELLKMARVVVSNDNGIAHFAGLTKTRSVALFSTDSPFVYGPLGDCSIIYSFYHCSPCISAFNHKQSKCRDNQCLKAISPEIVADYVQEALDGRGQTQMINRSIPYLR